ncbi:MAG: hypothetical protein IT460_06655 [Planctomycetes bacterium]|nr:hypothetical protein [Planctomycetota bacterium]
MPSSVLSPRAVALALGLAALGTVAVPAHTAEPAPTFNLELVSSLAGGATAVAVDGVHAYVTRGAAGFDVVDRTNPAAPTVVAHVLPGDGAAVYLRDCAVHDGHLWVANWDDVENGATGRFTGVYVYDVANPAAPVEVARLDWGTHAFYHLAAMVYDLAVADVGGTPYAFFVSEISNAVEVFDVTDPGAPVYAATLERPLSMLGVCEDVTVVGDTAYVAWLQGGVSSYDLSDLAAIAANNAVATDWGDLQYPALRMQHKGAIGNARGVAVDASGVTMVVTDDYGTGKLRVFDVVGVTTATPVGTFDAGTAADPLDVRIDGDRAFASWGADGLRVIDVSNPAAPTQVARYDTSNAKRCAFAGSHVLLADGSEGTLTLGFRDRVEVVTATWSKKAKRLTVQATSTASDVLPPAVLTVVGRGTMTWSSTAQRYTFTQTVSTMPSSVTVTSTWGGSTTATVSQIK